MTDPSLSTYTSVFRTAPANRIKRNRPPISCTACQRRKTKCDRQQPCSACQVRGSPEQCRQGRSPPPTTGNENEGGDEGTRVVAAATSGKRSSGSGVLTANRREVQARLTHLENIVKDLAKGGSMGQNISDGLPTSDTANGTGSHKNDSCLPQELQVDRSDESYRGATSWKSLVASIQDIQSILVSDSDPLSEAHSSVASSSDNLPPLPEVFLNPAGGTITLSEILESLPPRAEADRLIAVYFNSRFIAVPYIHIHQFRRVYEKFWDDPCSASYLWVSMLFSILCIATVVTGGSASIDQPVITKPNGKDRKDDAGKEGAKTYMVLAARCCAAGEYFHAKPLSVESLLLHTQCRNIFRDDADPGTWSIYGLIVRIAQRQGYHRELNHNTNPLSCPYTKTTPPLTPFAAEMRRRAWFMVQTSDIMHSFQQGLPPMVDDALCDTRNPSILTDDDFDEDSPVLPPSRDDRDPLPILAYGVKATGCFILRRVLRHALAVNPPPYTTILALHSELEAWHASIPACLRIRPIKSSSFTDPSYTIMHRIMLEIMYRKSLCMLHRPYLTSGQNDPKYDVCLDSAVKLLNIHVELDQAIQVGGRLYEDRYMVTSLTLHEFLVASMILCLDLSYPKPASEERTRRIELLKASADIWNVRSATSTEARHASKILQHILQRVTSPSLTPNTDSQILTPPQPNLAPNGLGLQQEQHQLQQPFSYPKNTTHEFHMDLDENGFMGDTDAMAIDWFSIDQYLRTGFDDDTNFGWPYGGPA